MPSAGRRPAPTIVNYAPIDLRGAVLALVASVFWGANPVVLKIGLLDAPPLRLASLRFLVGTVTIVIWAWLTGRLAGFRIQPEEWRPLTVLGLMFAAQVATMNVGTNLTSAAHSAILLNLYSVHTVVLAHFMIPGDRLTVRRLAGVLSHSVGGRPDLRQRAAPG
jgi:drug/metabolite transporter (DMT)-like permease